MFLYSENSVQLIEMASNDPPPTAGNDNDHNTDGRPFHFDFQTCCRSVNTQRISIADMPQDFQRSHTNAQTFHYPDYAHDFQSSQGRQHYPAPQHITQSTNPISTSTGGVTLYNNSQNSTPQPSSPMMPSQVNPIQPHTPTFQHPTSGLPLTFVDDHARASDNTAARAPSLLLSNGHMFSVDIPFLLRHSGLARWLHSHNQLFAVYQSVEILHIHSPILPIEVSSSAQTENLLMGFSQEAFDIAICFVCNHPDAVPLSCCNPIDLLKAFAYLQIRCFPPAYFSQILPNMNSYLWARFYYLHQFHMPGDILIRSYLENFNFWHVRMTPSSIARYSFNSRDHTHFFRAARSSSRSYRHWASGIQTGRCIICHTSFDRSDLTRPSRARNFYITECCNFYVHFGCWMQEAQYDDYHCRICG